MTFITDEEIFKLVRNRKVFRFYQVVNTDSDND
jgi:hypothetical protein